MIRTQPLLAPLMHMVDVDINVFYSPDRIVWDDCDAFHSGGDDGMDTTVAPYMISPEGGYAVGSLADQLGITPGVAGKKHSALPFRHYANIWNGWYRDSQLQAEVPISYGNGEDTVTSKALLNANWKRDYFTVCRPQPQLGPEVVIPLLGGDVPVKGIGGYNNTYANPGATSYETGADAPISYDNAKVSTLGAANNNMLTVEQDPNNPGYPNVRVNLDEVAGIDVIDLRESNAVQRHLEFNNMWGGRMIEQIMSRFGVRIPDYRLDRPEFLGSGETKIQFSEVLQTAPGDTPVGTMNGHGISIVHSHRYRRRVPEHGYVFVMLTVRPKTQYMQGLHRSWSRETKYDYLLPEFVHIGDQAVLTKELYMDAPDDEVFGYTPIYDEYRSIPSRVAGEFRDVLNYWHMATEYESKPALNSTFVTCTPTDRIYPAGALSGADQLLIEVAHAGKIRRPLPKVVNPKLL